MAQDSTAQHKIVNLFKMKGFVCDGEADLCGIRVKFVDDNTHAVMSKHWVGLGVHLELKLG